MMFDHLQHIDQELTLALNGVHSGITDYLMQFFSDKLVWIPMYILVIYFLFRRLGWKKGLVIVIAAALTFLVCDQLSNLFKDTVARLRPNYNNYMLEKSLRIMESRGGKYGFFSAHAANAFGFAVVTIKGFKLDHTRSYKAYNWAIVLWAVILSLSRVSVGKHFFGDVLAGSIIGTLAGLAVSALAKALIVKLKWQPQEDRRKNGNRPKELE